MTINSCRDITFSAARLMCGALIAIAAAAPTTAQVLPAGDNTGYGAFVIDSRATETMHLTESLLTLELSKAVELGDPVAIPQLLTVGNWYVVKDSREFSCRLDGDHQPNGHVPSCILNGLPPVEFFGNDSKDTARSHTPDNNGKLHMKREVVDGTFVIRHAQLGACIRADWSDTGRGTKTEAVKPVVKAFRCDKQGDILNAAPASGYSLDTFHVGWTMECSKASTPEHEEFDAFVPQVPSGASDEFFSDPPPHEDLYAAAKVSAMNPCDEPAQIDFTVRNVTERSFLVAGVDNSTQRAFQVAGTTGGKVSIPLPGGTALIISVDLSSRMPVASAAEVVNAYIAATKQ